MNKDERLVKQANGKYCIVDTFGSTTHFTQNLTPSEYINLRVSEAIRQATEDIEHAPKFSALRCNCLKVYDYEDINYIEDSLKEMGEEPLSQGERGRFKAGIEGIKAMEEAMEGYFK